MPSNKDKRKLLKVATNPAATQIAPTPTSIADPQIASILVPEFFVDRGFLDPYSFRNTYNYYDRKGTRSLLETSFKDKGDNAGKYAWDIILSLTNPFQGFSLSTIRWQYKRRPLKNGKKLTDEPYSIVSYFDEQNRVVCNVIHDGDGNCRFQVDFAKHGSDDVHWHALVPGNMDHAMGDDHAEPWQNCPWPWLCVCVTDAEKTSLPALSPNDDELICHQITSKDPNDRRVFEQTLLNMRSLFKDSGGMLTWTIFTLILVTVVSLLIKKFNLEYDPEFSEMAQKMELDIDLRAIDRFLSALVPPASHGASPS